jgi:hypothetical protein
MRADHVGDSRGNAWYTQLTCLAVDASVPLTSVDTNTPVTQPPPIKQY